MNYTVIFIIGSNKEKLNLRPNFKTVYQTTESTIQPKRTPGFPSIDLEVVFTTKKAFLIEALKAAETTLLNMHLGGKVGGTWMLVLNLLSLFH